MSGGEGCRHLPQQIKDGLCTCGTEFARIECSIRMPSGISVGKAVWVELPENDVSSAVERVARHVSRAYVEHRAAGRI